MQTMDASRVALLYDKEKPVENIRVPSFNFHYRLLMPLLDSRLSRRTQL